MRHVCRRHTTAPCHALRAARAMPDTPADVCHYFLSITVLRLITPSICLPIIFDKAAGCRQIFTRRRWLTITVYVILQW